MKLTKKNLTLTKKTLFSYKNKFAGDTNNNTSGDPITVLMPFTSIVRL